MIEKVLPSTKSKFRIIRAIYENPGINITELINEARVSPNLAVNYTNLLAKFDVVKESRSGGKKKTHLREISPNLSSNLGKLIFPLVEIEKRHLFLEKYKEFKPFVDQLEGLFADAKASFCLIYGSFARFAADKDSDVDILIVGALEEEERKRLSEIFVTLKREYSVEIETLNTFFKNIGDPFHRTIIKDHVVIWNEEEFVNCLGRLTN